MTKLPMWQVREIIAITSECSGTLHLGVAVGKSDEETQNLACYVRDDFNIVATFVIYCRSGNYTIIEVNCYNIYPQKMKRIANILDSLENNLNVEAKTDEI